MSSLYASQQRDDFGHYTEEIIVSHSVKHSMAGRNAAGEMREKKLLGSDLFRVKQMIKERFNLPNNSSWFIADHVPNTELYLISQTPVFRYREVAGIPFVEKPEVTQKFDGLIIDLENNFSIADFNRGIPIVIDRPLETNIDEKLELLALPKAFSDTIINELGKEEIVTGNADILYSFSKKAYTIRPLPDSPIVRVWKHPKSGIVYLSSSERIDAREYPSNSLSPVKKTYGEIYSSLGGVTEELFVLDEKAIFCFQMISQESQKTTNHLHLPGLVLLAVNGKSVPVQSFTLEEANDWAGFSSHLFPQLHGGDILSFETDARENGEQERYQIVPYSYTWRNDLLGTIDTLNQRFLELMNARFLEPKDFRKIFPVVGEESEIETPEGRRKIIERIFQFLLPVQIRYLGEGLVDHYWGVTASVSPKPKRKVTILKRGTTEVGSEKAGKIEHLVQHLKMRHDRFMESKAKLTRDEEVIFQFAASYADGDLEEKVRKVLFQDDPLLPHCCGNLLYKLIRDMDKIQALVDRKQNGN